MIARNLNPQGKRAGQQRTLAQVMARLGDVALERVRNDVWPGRATDADCTESKDRFGCLCEMVDGVLVEKIMGWEESRLAGILASLIERYLESHPLGIVIGPDGPIRIQTRVTRMPDVSFVSWDRIPGDELPAGPVMEVVPDLTVEIISRSNRPGEMKVKLREYFAAGVRLVWFIDFHKRAAPAYTSADDWSEIELTDSLEGKDVLPGLRIKLQSLFERAFPQRPEKRKK